MTRPADESPLRSLDESRSERPAPADGGMRHGDQDKARVGDGPSWFRRLLGWFQSQFQSQPFEPPKLTTEGKARLLYEYCVTSEKKVTETIHNLLIIADHYSGEKAHELDNPVEINGIPSFFKNLTSAEKSTYCYNQVIEGLSLEALPVTVESLLATKRWDPKNPWSSYAGRFVRG